MGGSKVMNRKSVFKILLIFAYFIILVLPLYFIHPNWSTSSTTEVLFLWHRIIGLYAFSLIFLQIIVGSGRTLLNRIFPAGSVLRFHMTQGKIAFLLALLHPALLFATYITENNLEYVYGFMGGEATLYFYLGVTALSAMFVSVFAAIFRAMIGPKWIILHRINYLIFWLVFFHSFKLGVDVQTPTTNFIYMLYGAIVAMLTARKVFILYQNYRLQKEVPQASTLKK
jgi:hypothetical protein